MAMEQAEQGTSAGQAVQAVDHAHVGHAGLTTVDQQPEQLAQQTAGNGEGRQQHVDLTQSNAHLMLLAMADPSAAQANPLGGQLQDGMQGSHANQGFVDGGPQQPDTGGMTDDNDDDSDMDDRPSGAGRPKQVRKKKPHLQGRFSGRLATKEDERRLAEECRSLAPLVGGVGKRGDRSMLTLAKIVRGIATGAVRRFLEGKEASHRALAQQVESVQVSGGNKVVRELQRQVDTLKRELDVKNHRIAQLEAAQGQQQQQQPASHAVAAPPAQQQLVLLQAPGQAGAGLYGVQGMLAAPGQAMAMDSAMQELRVLEQQLAQLQNELVNHQQQATQAAQNHSTALSRTQALHAEVRALAASQKDADPSNQAEASKAIRELSVAAQSEEKKVQMHFQTHHHHRAQAEALRHEVDNVSRRLQQVQAAIQQQPAQSQLQQVNMGGQEAMLFTLAAAGAAPQITLVKDEGPIVTMDDHHKQSQVESQLQRAGAFLQVQGAANQLAAQGLAGGLTAGTLAAAQSLASFQRSQFLAQQFSPFQQAVQVLPGMLPGMNADGTMS